MMIPKRYNLPKIPGLFQQKQQTRYGNERAEDEERLPTEVFGQKAGGGGGQDPGNAHETAQECILGGGEFLVGDAGHKGHIGCGAHAACEVFKADDP